MATNAIDVQAILEQLAVQGQQLAKLEAENASLKASKTKAITLKVSEKGALSVYGLGRFPVTLYKSQWLKLLTSVKAIQEFIKANNAKLTEKGE